MGAADPGRSEQAVSGCGDPLLHKNLLCDCLVLAELKSEGRRTGVRDFVEVEEAGDRRFQVGIAVEHLDKIEDHVGRIREELLEPVEIILGIEQGYLITFLLQGLDDGVVFFDDRLHLEGIHRSEIESGGINFTHPLEMVHAGVIVNDGYGSGSALSALVHRISSLKLRVRRRTEVSLRSPVKQPER